MTDDPIATEDGEPSVQSDTTITIDGTPIAGFEVEPPPPTLLHADFVTPEELAAWVADGAVVAVVGSADSTTYTILVEVDNPDIDEPAYEALGTLEDEPGRLALNILGIVVPVIYGNMAPIEAVDAAPNDDDDDDPEEDVRFSRELHRRMQMAFEADTDEVVFAVDGVVRAVADTTPRSYRLGQAIGFWGPVLLFVGIVIGAIAAAALL